MLGLNMKIAKSKLARMANCKVIIVLIIVALPFLFFFRYRENALKAFTCQDQPIPCKDSPTLDSNLSYDSDKAYELFEKLTPEGRQMYAWTEITVDVIFPIIYSLFLSLLMIWVFQKSSNYKSQQYLAMLPFIAILFDFCENVLIAIMLFDYQQKYLWV